MKFLAIPAFLAFFILVSCKKEYTCQCNNSFSTYDAGTVEMTKSQAKKHCKSLSAGETTCQVK
ncbi:MAG: hypothetical protein O9353_15500 [Bacteroidia bacterium]|nr:hypothetical protein [Bacteroidia bacterium]